PIVSKLPTYVNFESYVTVNDNAAKFLAPLRYKDTFAVSVMEPTVTDWLDKLRLPFPPPLLSIIRQIEPLESAATRMLLSAEAISLESAGALGPPIVCHVTP